MYNKNKENTFLKTLTNKKNFLDTFNERKNELNKTVLKNCLKNLQKIFTIKKQKIFSNCFLILKKKSKNTKETNYYKICLFV